MSNDAADGRNTFVKWIVRILAIGVLALAIGVTGLCWFLVSRSRALTDYIAALRAQGEKVTFVELTSKYSRVTNQTTTSLTNLARLLGPPPVDITALRMAQFVPPNRARVTWSEEQLTGVLSKEGGTNVPVVAWDDLKRRITEAGPALRELQRIVESPAPNLGFRNRSFETASIWQEKRQAASWLTCAALLALRNGHRDDALTNIQALAGLADLHREECSLVEQMARVAIAGAGIELTWEALQAGGWNDEQLASLQRSWERFDFLAAVEKGLEGERAFRLELLAIARSPDSYAQEPGRRPGSNSTNPLVGQRRLPASMLENDALFGLRYLQRAVELARQLQIRPGHEVMQAFQEHETKLDAMSRSATRFLYLMSLTSIPHFQKAVEQGAHQETLRRLAVVALALRRHELKHGRAPASLDALVPEFLTAVPRDCMDGRKLKYRLDNDGTFCLYSVGPDGRDDGGDPTPLQPDARFGKGRDTVWPTALKPSKPVPRESTAL